MCFHNRTWWIVITPEYILPSCTPLHDVRVCICIYLPCISTAAALNVAILLAIAAAAAACSCWSCCCMLLLFVIACRMAKLFWCSTCGSLFEQNLLLMHVPFGSTVAFAAPIYLYIYVSYILGNYGHAWSQGGCQPAAVKPLWNMYMHRCNVYTGPQSTCTSYDSQLLRANSKISSMALRPRGGEANNNRLARLYVFIRFLYACSTIY